MTTDHGSSSTELQLPDCLETMLSIMRMPVLAMDGNLDCLFSNGIFSTTFNIDPDRICGEPYSALDGGLLSGKALRRSLEDLASDHIEFDYLDIELDLDRLGRRIFRSSGTEVVFDSGFRVILLSLEDITEIRRTESEHRDREIKYSTLFETSRDAIMMLAPPNWRFIAGNPATLEMFGCRSEEEFTALGPWELSPPTQPDGENSGNRASLMIQKAMESGSCFFEWEHMRTDGETFPATVLLSRMELGNQQLLQATVRDISTRKRAESALRRREADFRSLIQNLPTVMYRAAMDKQWTIHFISREIEILSGYPASDFVENSVRSYVSIIHPEDRDLVSDMITIAVNKRTSYMIDYRIIRADGESQWVFEKGQGTFNPEGELLYLDGIIFDNTERKLMEVKSGKQKYQLQELVRSRTAELRESEEKYRTLVEQSHDGIYIYSSKRFMFVNDGMCELTGHTKDALYAIPFLDLIHPDDMERMQQYGETRETGGDAPSVYQVRIVRRDGQVRFVEFSVRVLTYHGEYAVLGICRDISDIKKHEQEQNRLQRLESLGILAGGIAHDFNNFLTGVMGNISLAKMLVEPGTRIHQILTNSERAAGKASGLTRQLLTFSKGGQPVKEDISLPNLLTEAAAFVLSGSNVCADFHIPEDLNLIIADRDQINQVIQNIILNADQAMPDGGSIEISASNIDVTDRTTEPLENGPYVMIEILDSGPGIPESIIQQIFDPFFSTKETGSGLGLATAYSILKKHSGLLSAANAPMGGLFTIYIPASVTDRNSSDPQPEELSSTVSGRILVMDDKAIVRRTAAAMLDHLGYEVEGASDGVEAVAAYRTASESGRPFDAVILDLTVPGGMGGQETMKELRSFDPGIRAIVSSGYSNDPVMADYRKYGFSGVVVKPYSLAKLAFMMKEILRKN